VAAGPGVRGGVGGSSNPALPRSSPRSACDHTRSVSASLCTRTSMSTCMFLCPSPSASLCCSPTLSPPCPATGPAKTRRSERARDRGHLRRRGGPGPRAARWLPAEAGGRRPRGLDAALQRHPRPRGRGAQRPPRPAWGRRGVGSDGPGCRPTAARRPLCGVRGAGRSWTKRPGGAEQRLKQDLLVNTLYKSSNIRSLLARTI
jgi:hypothetical protein